MGTVIHDAVLVQVEEPKEFGLPDLDAFRSQMPELLRRCLVGPFLNPLCGGMTVLWTPDGGKEGYRASNVADEWREKFIALWVYPGEPGDSPYDVLHIQFGGDMRAEGVPPKIREVYGD